MRHRFLNFVIGVVAAALLAGCSGLLFVPSQQLVRTPADIGLTYEDVDLTAADGTRLHGWWLPAEGESRGRVLFLHGNAENISTHIASVFWLPEQGYGVFLLDYRGYGRSEGTPRLPGVFGDIEAALDWVLERPAGQDRPVFVLGQSLGAAMGGYVAASTPRFRAGVDGVVLDSGFTRYSTIAREVASRHWLTWLFQWPVAWGMPDGYDLVDVIDDISPKPLLLIHGTGDTIIPFTEVEALYEAARPPKELLVYDGDHIATFSLGANRKALLEFLSGARPAGTGHR